GALTFDKTLENVRVECPRVFIRRIFNLQVVLAYLLGIKAKPGDVKALYESTVCQDAHIAEHRRADLRCHEARHVLEIRQLLVEHLARLVDRDADTVESLLNICERLDMREVTKDDFVRRRALLRFPLKEVAD